MSCLHSPCLPQCWGSWNHTCHWVVEDGRGSTRVGRDTSFSQPVIHQLSPKLGWEDTDSGPACQWLMVYGLMQEAHLSLTTFLFCVLWILNSQCREWIHAYGWWCHFAVYLRLSQRLLIDYQFSSVAQSCLTLCDPMNRSTPGLPVHHQLLEFTQTQVHRVGDAIQPSHPLSSPSPPAPNPSQHQGLFQWANSSHEVAEVLTILQYKKKTPPNLSPSLVNSLIKCLSNLPPLHPNSDSYHFLEILEYYPTLLTNPKSHLSPVFTLY